MIKDVNLEILRCKDCGKECSRAVKYRIWQGRCRSCSNKHKGKIENRVEILVGIRFGFLTVIEEDGRYGRSVKWLCECQCGKRVSVIATNLRSGVTRSCGCYQRQRASETHSLKDGESFLTLIWHEYKDGAESRGLVWNLTKEQVRSIIINNCFYCGSPPQRYQRWRTGKPYIGSTKYNGIDRIDNDNGYCLGNCVSCCTTCNRAKGALTYDEFIVWLTWLVNHRIEYASEINHLKIV